MPYTVNTHAAIVALRNAILNEEQFKRNRNPARIRIIDPEDGFIFGNCAEKAITSAFKVDRYLTREIFQLMGVNCSKGCTQKQCDKCINSLCRIKGKMSRYTTNRTHLSSTTFYMKNKKGLFILNFPGHLSVLKNGTVYDSYFGESWFKSEKLMGWWEIK
jgi:hypothetical protein